MSKIVSYLKYSNEQITRELILPEDANHQRLGTELATLDGITYVSLPDGASLPSAQPEEIAASIQTVTLSPALHAAIADASPHVRLIRTRVQEMIRARYSADDELKLLRLNVGQATPSADFSAYHAFVENGRQWGAAAKAELGL